MPVLDVTPPRTRRVVNDEDRNKNVNQAGENAVPPVPMARPRPLRPSSKSARPRAVRITDIDMHTTSFDSLQINSTRSGVTRSLAERLLLLSFLLIEILSLILRNGLAVLAAGVLAGVCRSLRTDGRFVVFRTAGDAENRRAGQSHTQTKQ